uniref:Alpha-1,4-N-acetylglucosaminyltransferase n=1 Tax=Haptolina ericina TaxID=156174 RepID=A0A7S3F116_9EUKA
MATPGKACNAGVVNITRDTHPYAYWDLKTCMNLVRRLPQGAPLCPDARRDPNGKVIFHVYWSALKSLHRHAFRLIASYLATQDLTTTELWLWSPREMKRDPLFQPFLKVPNVKTKRYDADAEVEGGPLSRHPRRKSITGTTDNKAWADGDLFRLSILHKYGGVYIDADTVLLRDFTPLLGMEFVYNWGNDCTLPNGAIMRLHQGSQAGKGMLHVLATRRPGGISWGPETYQAYWLKTNKKGIDVLPTCFFNPHWLAGCSGCTPWSDQTPSMWNGPFAIHVHGGIWRGQPPSGSDYCRVAALISKQLTASAGGGWSADVAANITAYLPCGSAGPSISGSGVDEMQSAKPRRKSVMGEVEAALSGRSTVHTPRLRTPHSGGGKRWIDGHSWMFTPRRVLDHVASLVTPRGI